MRSFVNVYEFRLLPTLSNFLPKRADTVAVVVVVVDVAGRRNAKKIQRMALVSYCRSLVRHASAMCFTS